MQQNLKAWISQGAVWESRIGGFQEGGFQIVERAAFSFVWKSVIAWEFLLKIDTSLAIATSGLRTNLLFEKPLPKTPHLILPSSKTRRRNRRESRDFGGLRWRRPNSAILAVHRRLLVLSGPTARPPYRAIRYRHTYRTCAHTHTNCRLRGTH